MHVMIDLETLSTRQDAAIIQVGAVLFEPVSGGKVLNNRGFNRYVLVQDGAGAIDHSTVAWWLQQPNARTMGKTLEEAAQPLAIVLDDLVRFPQEARDLSWEAIGGVWAKPSNFDLGVLASAFARFGAAPPWEHWKTMCARTLFNLVGGQPQVDETGLTRHDALDDAVIQAMAVQKAMGLLAGRR